MLLSELTGVKHLKSKTPKELLQYMEDLEGTKLRKLGMGANGAAFTDGKVVYKFWHRDTGYENFIKYARRYKNSPSMPKFLSPVKSLPFDIVTGEEDGQTVKGLKYVKMELLDRAPTKVKVLSPKGLQAYNVKASNNKIDVDNIADIWAEGDAETLSAALRAAVEFTFKVYDEDDDEGVDESRFDPMFLDVMRRGTDLVRMFGESELFIYDVHRDNFGKRPGTDQLVFLDPLADNDSIYYNSELLR